MNWQTLIPELSDVDLDNLISLAYQERSKRWLEKAKDSTIDREPTLEEVLEAVNGNKITAIKNYRNRTGEERLTNSRNIIELRAKQFVSMNPVKPIEIEVPRCNQLRSRTKIKT